MGRGLEPVTVTAAVQGAGFLTWHKQCPVLGLDALQPDSVGLLGACCCTGLQAFRKLSSQGTGKFCHLKVMRAGTQKQEPVVSHRLAWSGERSGRLAWGREGAAGAFWGWRDPKVQSRPGSALMQCLREL